MFKNTLSYSRRITTNAIYRPCISFSITTEVENLVLRHSSEMAGLGALQPHVLLRQIGQATSALGPKRQNGGLIFSSAGAWDADTTALVSMTSL
jgi:hypothetical protein